MKRLAVIAVVSVALLGAALAGAQPVQRGDLRVRFDASFTPHALPRDRPAPVTVSFTGSIATDDGSPPPPLRRISLALNRYGHLTTRGLPTCRRDELETTSSEDALARCRPALVGHGRFGAQLVYPNGSQLPVEGRVLAFNGRLGARPAIFVHVAARSPIQASVVLVFHISHPRGGKFGIVATTRIPRIASDLGYVSELSLTLGRRYELGGRPLSLLSASCAAPSGFPGALFSFARGTFAFANGQSLRSTVVRDCVVR